MDSYLIKWEMILKITISIVAAIFAFIGSWTSVGGWIDNIRGTFHGKITLEDGASPLPAKIIVTPGNIQITPDKDGFFSESIQRGEYSITVSADGYEPLTLAKRKLFGTKQDQLPEIKLLVKPKIIKINLHDKKNSNYDNITYVLDKFDVEPRVNYEVINKDKAYYSKNEVGYGQYRFVIGPYTSTSDSFLWTKSFNQYVGLISVNASQNSYSIELPRIIYFERQIPTTSNSFQPSDEIYFAQSITVGNIKFCGIGLGIGLGKEGVPSSFEIREDNKGIPGKILHEAQPFPPPAATSYGAEGTYASFCKKDEQLSLPLGTYWVIAKYNDRQSKINFLGSPNISEKGSRLLTSKNGHDWNSINIGNLKVLDLFIAE